METFYTILTNVGRAKIANAHANRQALELSIMAVGDGGGSYYNPSEDLTALKREVYRRELNNLVQDPDNAAYLICEMAIPSTVGGFYVREAGIFDAEGDMIAVGKIPETYKPALEAGAAKDLYVRFVMEVSNAETVTLKIDPSVVLATKEMAETAASNAVTVHVGEVNPHGQYLMRSDYTAEDVLNKIKTITGGSEYLNADRLGGVSRETLEAAIAAKQPAGDYATAGHGHSLTEDKISGVLPVNKGGIGAADILNAAKNLRCVRYGDWRLEWNNNADSVSESCVLRCQFTSNIPDDHNYGQLLTVYDGSSDTKSQIYFGLGTAGYYFRTCVGSVWEDWKRVFSNKDVILVENGGTGNTEGRAVSIANEQASSSMPVKEGFTSAWIYNSQTQDKGVPDGGWFSTLLTAHKVKGDGINDTTAQLFFGEGNRAWLRTSSIDVPVAKDSPWKRILTENDIRTIVPAMPTAATWAAINTNSDYSLPAGGTYAYYCTVIGNNFPLYTGIAAGGTYIGSGSAGAMRGFYWKVA